MSHAIDALEFLEEAAADGIGEAEFLKLLEKRENYDPAWSEGRAAEARVYLLEAVGRLEEAAIELEARSHRLLATDDHHAVDEADLLFGHLESLGPVGSASCERLRGRLEAVLAARDAIPFDLPAKLYDQPLDILVVGGNEVQARMDEDIQAEIIAHYPRITVHFLHTGWASNWRHYRDEFDRRCEKVDGVVFLSLMRTMLGRRLRQSCPVPWRGCGRAGKGAIVETIRRLIPFALADLERRRSALDAPV